MEPPSDQRQILVAQREGYWGGFNGSKRAVVWTCAAGAPLIYARTSDFFIRPSRPVPGMCAGSKLFSITSFLTTGDNRKLGCRVGVLDTADAFDAAGAEATGFVAG